MRNMISFDQRDQPARCHQPPFHHPKDGPPWGEYVRFKYLAKASTSATQLSLSSSSTLTQAAHKTKASVASPLGACNTAYTFSPLYSPPAALYSNFCFPTFSPKA